MNKLTFENNKGKIVAKLYIKENGNLHDDSWLCPKGWPEDKLTRIVPRTRDEQRR